MADLRQFHGPNAGYVLDLFERFSRDPQSVDEGWRAFFQEFTPASLDTPDRSQTGGTGPAIRLVLGARELARSIRSRGHTAADLNPLGRGAEVDPALDPAFHGISEDDLQNLPAEVVRGPAAEGAPNAAAAIARLRELYSGTVGYEFAHIPNADERSWLRDAIESCRYSSPATPEKRRALLARLSQVEGFERYLHKAFFGQKRFSVEGTDMLVPMLDEVIEEAGLGGAQEVLIGMAHRGRLNVLTHVLEKPAAKMIAGFQGGQSAPVADGTNPDIPSGDVKYHMGWRSTRQIDGREVKVTLAPNPSHLEYVDPVVVGMTRAAQDRTDQPGSPPLSPSAALAVLVHGDAAFPGQGVVAETLNMSGLPGYSVGGTIHVIANNQVGFTTNPEQGRSTRYSSDLAKGFEVPVVHVNADDAEACLAVARLAHAYRARWGKDFVIDLVGYRRWGHNEGDEPAFTQPLMYEIIRNHPTVRERLARELVEAGTVSQADADGMFQQVLDRLAKVRESLAEGAGAGAGPAPSPNGQLPDGDIQTAVPEDQLARLNEQLLARPEGFTGNARLAKLLEQRREAPQGSTVDWGHAELLAFASLLAEGVPVRLSGQDAERGTFSHRHVVLHDAESGDKLNLLTTLPAAQATFEVYNSPLSEMAVVGFEYGYSVYDPQVLVVWEAQFGDFANSAQVMIDQFLSAGEQKWGQTSGMVLLLPHGYEGQGPEHSSARLERFLQLAAESNLRVANCTTSAQYFHLLRRQASLLRTDPRPLVVMSPKSLLRHPLAASRLEQLATGTFQPLLADEAAAERADETTRLLLCSGKVYADLVAGDLRAESPSVALARVEELYPFPTNELQEVLNGFPALQEIVWVQEEPRNMGAWRYVEPRLRALAGDGVRIGYVGRAERASPAEGSADRHKAEQERIVAAAWGGAPQPSTGEGTARVRKPQAA